MSPETLILAFGIGWGIWILMRLHRKRKAAQLASRSAGGAPARSGAGATAAAVPGDPGTMPRLGTPGSVTYNQIKALQRNGFTPDRGWSEEEAALILDAVAYLRIVCHAVAERTDGPPPLEVQNELMRFILTQQDLRDYVRKWGEGLRAEGHDPLEAAEEEQPPALARNNQYNRVAAKAHEFLSA